MTPRQSAMKRILAPLTLIACAVLAGCATQGTAPARSSVPSASASPAAAARADAISLLASFRPPPGAKILAEAPSPVPTALSVPFPDDAGSNPTLVLLTQWWSYPGTAAQAVAWFSAHRPQGTTSGAFGSTSEPDTYSTDLSYDRPVTRELAERTLGIMVDPVDGHTLLRVDAFARWLPPRPAGAVVPVGATRLVVVARPGSTHGERPKPVTLATVTDPRLIGAVAALVNGLPVPVPGAVYGCPMDDGASLLLDFYGTGGSTPLASVSAAESGCGGVQLSVRGGPQDVSLDGRMGFTSSVLSVLRLSFPTS
jgi:hypothetical protein